MSLKDIIRDLKKLKLSAKSIQILLFFTYLNILKGRKNVSFKEVLHTLQVVQEFFCQRQGLTIFNGNIV